MICTVFPKLIPLVIHGEPGMHAQMKQVWQMLHDDRHALLTGQNEVPDHVVHSLNLTIPHDSTMHHNPSYYGVCSVMSHVYGCMCTLMATWWPLQVAR